MLKFEVSIFQISNVVCKFASYRLFSFGFVCELVWIWHTFDPLRVRFSEIVEMCNVFVHKKSIPLVRINSRRRKTKRKKDCCHLNHYEVNLDRININGLKMARKKKSRKTKKINKQRKAEASTHHYRSI